MQGVPRRRRLTVRAVMSVIDNVRIPALTDDENRTVNKLIDGLAARIPRNLERASFYDGKQAIRHVGTTIPAQYQNLGLALGWAAKGVDGLGRRCNIDRFIWNNGSFACARIPSSSCTWWPISCATT